MEISSDLVASSSAPAVLAALAAGEGHGYVVVQRVRELCGGRLEWPDGMVYPVLHRLERLGHLEARWEVPQPGRRRKHYRLTPRGRALCLARPPVPGSPDPVRRRR